MADLPFPKSSTPGATPAEGEGRYVNCAPETVGGQETIRRVPGLTAFSTTGFSGARGLIDVAGTIYAARNSGVVSVAADGTASLLTGALPGSDGVIFARNNRVTSGVSTPDLVAVAVSGGAYVIAGGGVSPYPDADLPTPNSVTFLDGYLLFTVADGRIFASGLNTTAVDPLSFATAEASADGLVRGAAKGGKFYAFGSASIEVWLNNGTSPFPLVRAPTVLPIGLLAPMAVAGHEEGWDGGLLFVASDRTVRRLVGYEQAKVSSPAVERFIAASTASTLEAMVSVIDGKPFFALSSDQGTWELNVATGGWRQRVSAGTTRWRASKSVLSNGRWIVGDTLSTQLLAIDGAARTEAGAALDATIESGPLKGFPARVSVPALFANFTPAALSVAALSYSHDGGRTWASHETRSLSTADGFAVRWNRLGLSTHNGLRVRFTVSGADDWAFLGASVPDPKERRP